MYLQMVQFCSAEQTKMNELENLKAFSKKNVIDDIMIDLYKLQFYTCSLLVQELLARNSDNRLASKKILD